MKGESISFVNVNLISSSTFSVVLPEILVYEDGYDSPTLAYL